MHPHHHAASRRLQARPWRKRFRVWCALYSVALNMRTNGSNPWTRLTWTQYPNPRWRLMLARAAGEARVTCRRQRRAACTPHRELRLSRLCLRRLCLLCYASIAPYNTPMMSSRGRAPGNHASAPSATPSPALRKKRLSWTLRTSWQQHPVCQARRLLQVYGNGAAFHFFQGWGKSLLPHNGGSDCPWAL